MTEAQLNRGNEIASEIRKLEEQLEKWQNAGKLRPGNFIRLATSDDYSNIDVHPHYINFGNMKNDAIKIIKEELLKFRTELKNL